MDRRKDINRAAILLYSVLFRRGIKMDFDECIDTTGLKCPLPILKAKKSLAKMTSQQVLKIIVTDFFAKEDFKLFCLQTGNVLLDVIEEQNKYIFFIKRK